MYLYFWCPYFCCLYFWYLYFLFHTGCACSCRGCMMGPLGIVKTLRRPEVSHSCLHDILHVRKVHMDIRSSPSTTPSFKTDSDSESKYVFLRVNLFNCDIFVSRQPGLSHGAFGWQCRWSDPGSGLLANENTKQSTQDIVYYSCICIRILHSACKEHHKN